MSTTVEVRGEGVTVELLLWRKYRAEGKDLVVPTLKLNPGLAALGPYLPLGTVVEIPDLPNDGGASAVPVITLFGEA